MNYPNNDLWSVRQIEFLEDALKGYEGSVVEYYPNKQTMLIIPEISTYEYLGVLYFRNQDRTVIFEQGENFGLKRNEILKYLKTLNIRVNIIEDAC